jgi:hypothetical protein
MWGVARFVAACGTALAAVLVPATAGAATITPTGGFLSDNFTNDANCSAREAISVANQDGSTSEDSCGVNGTLGDDTVVLGPGPYSLTLAGQGEDSNVTGDLDARTDSTGGDLTIQGAGGSTTTLNATGLGDRVLHNPAVDASNTLTIEGLKLTGALIPGQSGGGLFHVNEGDIALNDVIVSGNTAGGGAGISFGGPGTSSLSLTNTTVGPNNNGTVGGGGIQASGAAVTLTQSDVTGDSAPIGGGIRLVSGASLVASGATTEIKQNTATIQGGGIQAETGNVTLNAGVHLSNNQINDANGGFGAGLHNNQGPGGGDVTLNGATVSGNTITASDPTGNADGAGIRYFADGTVTLNGAAVTSNSGSAGDGIGGGLSISSGGTLIAESSLIAANSLTLADNATTVGEGGGGIGLGPGVTGTLTRTTVDSNHLIQNDPQDTVGGSGIFNNSASLTLDSSTVSDNDIGGSPLARHGAGIMGSVAGDIKLLNSTVVANAGGTSSFGGGIAYETSSADTLTIAHSTVATNTATTAPGIFRSGSGTIALRGSIVDQGAAGCVGGSITANAFNVDRATSCVGGADDTDLENTDPLLGGLADNGGATDTLALPLGSPAVNAVTANCLNLGGTALLADQRGYPRPFPPGGACDAGSYELFTCDGVAQNPVGPFTGCPAPPGPPTTQPPTTQPPTTTQPDTTQPDTTKRKKCKKKKKHKHRAAAAKKHKKKCKHKKRR